MTKPGFFRLFRGHRIPFCILHSAFCILFSACASTPSQTVTEVPRTRNYVFERMGDEARAVYVPKGAYLVGLKPDASYPVDSWVRFVPGKTWPDEEPRPAILTGRVAERTKDAARLEILAVQDQARDPMPGFEGYPVGVSAARGLHAMTKRLVFPAADVHGRTIETVLTRADVVEGNEIYGAFDLEGRGRVASQFTAIVRAQVGQDGKVALTPLAGTVPDNPAFVLLDAMQEPAFDVRIVLAKSNNRALTGAIAGLLGDVLPGKDHIHLYETRHQGTGAVIHALGQAQTETIDVELFDGDGRTLLIDQGIRVSNAPFGVVLTDNDDNLSALAAVSRAYMLLGNPASAAWILENAWKSTDLATRRAAIAPALAEAYRALERDDWALEIALELREYAGSLSKKEKAIVLTGAAASAAIAGRAGEFEAVFNEIHTNHAQLPPAWLRTFTYASLLSGGLPKWREYTLNAVRSKDWNEFDRLYACLFRGEEDEDWCAIENATTDFSNIWIRTMQAVRNENPSELLELIGMVDDIGAPNLGVILWSGFVSMGGEAALKAWLNAAQYARRAQQYRQYLRMMVHYALERNSGDVFSDVISGLRSLDWRTELAHLCVMRSAFTTPGETVELLHFATELYLSIGDSENAAIAFSKLSCAYEQAGQTDLAIQTRNQARLYGGRSHQKEVLQALEESSCQPSP